LLPSEFVQELKKYHVDDCIQYIQPDYQLSLDSLSLELGDQPNESAVPSAAEEIDTTTDLLEAQQTDEEIEEENIIPDDETNAEPAEVSGTISERRASPLTVLVAVIDNGMDVGHDLLANHVVAGWNATDGSDVVYDDDNLLAYRSLLMNVNPRGKL
jgi:subtilisin family serine protease